MSISFQDSLKRALGEQPQEAIAAAAPMMPMVAAEEPGIMTLEATNEIAAFAGENWMQDMKYLYYPEYSDDNLSMIDEDKNVVLDKHQINLTQETNSQFIPFQMPRYYDGFDLVTTNLLVHFVNKEGYEDFATPVNVTYSDTKIRFGWLVDKRVTAIEGTVQFEIHAVGTNSKGDEYIWKTKPSASLNVLKSLEGNGVIEPDQSWITNFLTLVTEQVSIAQSAARQAENTVSTVQSYANQAAASASDARSTVQTAKAELEATVASAVNTKVNDVLINYYTQDEVDELFENFDISDQLEEVKQQIDSIDGLAAFNVEYNGKVMTFYNGNAVMKEIEINSDPSAQWTATYTAGIEEKIRTAKTEVQSELDSYKATVDADLESIHNDIDGLPETLANDYYTKTASDAKFALKNDLSLTNATANTNKQSITTLTAKVGELEDELDTIDKSPRLTYDISYNEDGDYMLKFYEIQNEGNSETEIRTEKATFVIRGGGGGSSSGSTLKIGYVTKTPLVTAVNDKVLITYNFSGTDSNGDEVLEGVATWKIGNTVLGTPKTISAGENTFDATEYVKLGEQKLTLSITDDAGSKVVKSWTVQVIDVRLTTNFDDTIAYSMGSVPFNYTVYGAISKDVHFILDGEEIATVNTSRSGYDMDYTLPAQSHGSHLLDVYMTAALDDKTLESNHIVKDILWVDSASDVPVIGTVYQKFTALQYATTNIVITVVDPKTETPFVQLYEDGHLVSERTLTDNTFTWQYKSSVEGVHNLEVVCGETRKPLVATIEKIDIEVNPVTAGLVFDFNPTGKNNNAVDRIWSTDTVAMTVSDNFDWVNGGYQTDANGDQYFCIKAGTSAEIDYKLFADDAKKNGKEFKLVFKTTNVAKPDAVFLHCMDNTTASNHIGIQMSVHEANIYGQAGSLNLPYSEEDIIEFEFNISKNTEDVPMVMGYEDGVSTRPMVYDDSYNFTQNTPKIISLGSEDCDLHIYRFKVYNTSLSASSILNNFIADARSAQEMVDRYNRNDIYDDYGLLDPDVLAEKCPWLRVYKISAPYFTNNKSDKVPYTTIQQIYKNGDPILDNWTCYDCSHSGQGTSSNNYGAAGRNLDFIMNKSQRDGVKPYFILGDGSRTDKITMTRTSVPVAYLNAKVNIASSNNMTNAMLANRYNEFKPYTKPFVRDEGVDTSFIKDTMEFNNCVIFIQETNEDLSTHREFADRDYHFYAIGNIGDSKKTDETRKTDIDDKYECCVEIMDVELPLSDFPADTMYNAMGYNIDEQTNDKIYIWAKNENLGILHELVDGEYVLTEDSEIDLNKTYYVDILEHDDFSEAFTYGWRYLYEGDDDEENAEVFDYCKQKWIEFYRFVTTSTDEDFKANLGKYMVVDTALYYYLFTTRYTMADNRAKNSFWHYAKTGETDAEGQPIRKWMLDWAYDMDTSLGLNNYGKQVYRYGLEDIDKDANGDEVFRESDSTFFCRIRDLFGSELKAMYNTLESKNAWHAESFINKADQWQSEFPEELWRLDIERKYIRTYNSSFINGGGDSQFLVNMSNGKMKYHRRQWERSQEKYMASKYQSATASSDNAVFRCSVPEGDLAVKPNYRLKLTPYAYMYLNVKYGTQNPIQLRAEPNKVYEIPFDGAKADIVDIYSSSLIQDFGDLSTCYVATADTTKASKVKKLILGNSTEGYDNPSFTTLTTGANYLLEELNVENISGLTQSLDLSKLNNLRELYAHGSNASGVKFADGGRIEIAELPAIGSMTMKNLLYLTTLDISALDNLTSLTVENCSTVDLIDILDDAPHLNRLRLTGVDWTLENTALLERIYKLSGIDKDGNNADRAVLAGKVYIPVIKQQQLREYHEAWPDLDLTYGSMIQQYAATFKNYDGSVLEVQYVDAGQKAVDPTSREEAPLTIPVKPSNVSHDFTFAGWDLEFTALHTDTVYTAQYTESLREYTVKYVRMEGTKEIVLQQSKGLYGENIPYTGEIPVYTGQESAFTYNLFDRWDKTGLINGDKTVYAVFDTCTYSNNYFENRQLKDLRPVEIYMMIQMGLEESVILPADEAEEESNKLTIQFGQDYEFDEIKDKTFEYIPEKQIFNGKTYIDTKEMLFNEDKDFVLAIDYKFTEESGFSVLAGCVDSYSGTGFKLTYNNGVQITWGASSYKITESNVRDMLVIRHKKGNNNLMVYSANMTGDEPICIELEKVTETIIENPLVFGCQKNNDGSYEHYATGEINWCKLWYADLGDDACKAMAMWPHEKVEFEACGFKNYYLTGSTSKRCSFSLLATHLLEYRTPINDTSYNTGGWAKFALNKQLNSRLAKAIPAEWKTLIKQVQIPSSIGDKSMEISYSDCYITIPALIEVDATKTTEPYINEGKSISYISNNDSRKRALPNGESYPYWLRSPNVSYSPAVWSVTAEGTMYGYGYPDSNIYGVLIEVSI